MGNIDESVKEMVEKYRALPACEDIWGNVQTKTMSSL
jgi:hypothetical protein